MKNGENTSQWTVAIIQRIRNPLGKDLYGWDNTTIQFDRIHHRFTVKSELRSTFSDFILRELDLVCGICSSMYDVGPLP